MHFGKIIAALALAASTVAGAHRPVTEPICDFYTRALLTNNTADNQYLLLRLLVNTVIIGNCKNCYHEAKATFTMACTYNLTNRPSVQTPNPTSALLSPASSPRANSRVSR